MLIHGIDLSRWQIGLAIDQVKADPLGVKFVNISLSKGTSAPPSIGESRQRWAADAKAGGLARLGYHWLDDSAPGATQWEACRREAVATFGGLAGWGLQVDCESTATLNHVLDFRAAARAVLGRPIAFYTGDWWLDPKGWPDLAAHFPHLWAAPNTGWLPGPPGEMSPHWRWTSKGGWSHLSLIQWGAERKIGGIKVSSSVVRSPEVLCELTGTHVEI